MGRRGGGMLPGEPWIYHQGPRLATGQARFGYRGHYRGAGPAGHRRGEDALGGRDDRPYPGRRRDQDAQSRHCRQCLCQADGH